MKTTTILERNYMSMLGVLPPRIMKTGANGVNGFLVGEVTDHQDGARYGSYFKGGDWYIAGPLMNVVQFLKAVNLTEEELREDEETPDNVQTELDLYEPHSKEAVLAYIELGIELNDELENFEEAYAGQFDSDEDFARDMARETGALMNDDEVSWPYTCIDWEWASKELMYDYSEQDGFYFRNI